MGTKKEQVLATVESPLGLLNESIDTSPVVTLPDGPVAHVGLEYGLTLNLGNYESARVTVSVTMPCKPGEVDATYTHIQDWTQQRLTKEIDAIRRGGKGSVF